MAKETCLCGKGTCLFDYDIGLGAEDVLVHAGRNIYLYI